MSKVIFANLAKPA